MRQRFFNQICQVSFTVARSNGIIDMANLYILQRKIVCQIAVEDALLSTECIDLSIPKRLERIRIAGNVRDKCRIAHGGQIIGKHGLDGGIGDYADLGFRGG